MLNVSVDIYRSELAKEEPVMNCLLWKKDSLVISKQTTYGIKQDSMPEGKYWLEVIYQGDTLAKFYNIVVSPGKRNYYEYQLDMTVNDPMKGLEKVDTLRFSDPRFEEYFSFLMGDNRYGEPSRLQHNQEYSGGFGANIFGPATKFYLPGYHVGFSYNYTVFKKDSSTVYGQPIHYQDYRNLNVNVGFINRFTFFNSKLSGTNGLKLDAGLIYNFPIFFREHAITDYRTRVQTRWIHRYNDFYAIARLAYKYVGVQAEYNLTTFLKTGYTEVPKFRVGLVFMIGYDAN